MIKTVTTLGLTVLALLLLVLGTSASAQEDVQDLTVWTTLTDTPLHVLEETGEFFQNYSNNPVSITVVPFDSIESLVAKLDPSGELPDVVIAPSEIGSMLLEPGSVVGYCVDAAACEVCRSPNPPRWCWYANVGSDWQLYEPNDMLTDPTTGLDIFRIPVTTLINDDYFPYGIIILWERMSDAFQLWGAYALPQGGAPVSEVSLEFVSMLSEVPIQGYFYEVTNHQLLPANTEFLGDLLTREDSLQKDFESLRQTLLEKN